MSLLLVNKNDNNIIITYMYTFILPVFYNYEFAVVKLSLL